MAKNIELKERGTNQLMYPLTTSKQVLHTDNQTLYSIIEDFLNDESLNVNNIVNSVLNNLPKANSETLGLVKVDPEISNGISINEDGKLQFTGTSEDGTITSITASQISDLNTWLDNNYDPWFEVNDDETDN